MWWRSRLLVKCGATWRCDNTPWSEWFPTKFTSKKPWGLNDLTIRFPTLRKVRPHTVRLCWFARATTLQRCWGQKFEVWNTWDIAGHEFWEDRSDHELWWILERWWALWGICISSWSHYVDGCEMMWTIFASQCSFVMFSLFLRALWMLMQDVRHWNGWCKFLMPRHLIDSFTKPVSMSHPIPQLTFNHPETMVTPEVCVGAY